MEEVVMKEDVAINEEQKKWIGEADVKWFDDGGKVVAPKGYLDNLRYRVWINKVNLKGIDDGYGIRRELRERGKGDLGFFFNTFLWTQDPRRSPSDLPFITYSYEDEYIRWVRGRIDGKKDGLTEKSRDMGVTWSILGVFVWYWLYSDGFLAHVGSKKEDDVDRSSDIRSLFEKMRYMVRNLPAWMLPVGFDWKKHSMFMRLVNPYNGNVITGESSNRDFGRGGRYSVVLLDEFAFMEYADEAWTATGDASPCRLAVSTPGGTGNKFWQLRFKSPIERMTLHWTLHPDKSKDSYIEKSKILNSQEAYQGFIDGKKVRSPWYDNEVYRRMTSESQSKIDIAQELDIDYLISGNPYFDISTLSKQKEWEPTDNWLDFDISKQKVIIGKIIELDNKVEFRPDKNGWLRLFEVPSKDGQYVCGIDAAEGLNSQNYSCAAVRNKKTYNLVAGIYGHFDYDELSYYSHLVCRYFNNCMVAAESGGYGAAVNKRLYDLGAYVARAVDFSEGSPEINDKLGFMTTTKSRPKMLGDVESEIREKAVELRDKDLKGECMNFIVKDGKPQAAEGSTDDYLFAFAIAGQLIRFFPYSKVIEKNYNKSIDFKMPPMNMGYSFKKDK